MWGRSDVDSVMSVPAETGDCVGLGCNCCAGAWTICRAEKKARVLNGKAGASAPPRHGWSCHCAHGRKTKEDDRQGARHGCPAAASTKYVAAGVPALPCPPRHICSAAASMNYTTASAPPRHVCSAAASMNYTTAGASAPPRLLCCRTRSALWMQPVFRLRKGCKTRHFFINTCKTRQGDV